MGIQKAKYDTGFAQIPNETLQNTKLSRDARAILFYLLSLPEDWKVSREHIMKRENISKTSYHKYFNELKAKGYVAYEQTRKNGKVTGGDYLVYPVPQEHLLSQSPKKCDSGETTANSGLYQSPKKSDSEKVGHIQRNSNTNKQSSSKPEPAQAGVSTFDFDGVVTWLLTQFSSVYDLNDIDRIFINASLEEYQESAKRPSKARALSWVETALKNRMSTEKRSMKISDARDQRNNAVTEHLCAQAKDLDSKSNNLNRRNMTTADQLNDTSWADDDWASDFEQYDHA